MNSEIRERSCISVIGGHELWREAICILLSRMMPTVTVFHAPNENDPVFDAGYVNLLLYCLSPPYLKGLEQLLALRHRFPQTPVIMISDAEDDVATMARTTHGVSSFLRASSSIEDLLSTITDVLAGKQVSPSAKQKGRRRLKLSLSPRQMEVFVLLCQGKTNKEIGSLLEMSDNTVRTHVSAIFDSLGVRNRTEAASLGRQLIGVLLFCLSVYVSRFGILPDTI